MPLNLEQLKTAYVLKTQDIDVPELGGSIRISQMSGASGMDVAKSSPSSIPELEKAGRPEGELMSAFYVALIAACVVDDGGKQVLNDEAGRAIVASWPYNVISTVGTACAELNGMIDAKKN